VTIKGQITGLDSKSRINPGSWQLAIELSN